MNARLRFSHRGSAMLEVAVAMTLLALTATAVMCTHLFSTRTVRLAAQREQAALVAVSVAHSLRTGGRAQRLFDAPPSVLPPPLAPVRVSARSFGEGIAQLFVSWAPASANSVTGVPPSCEPAHTGPRGACMALPFAE